MSKNLSKFLGMIILVGSFVGGWYLMDLQAFMKSPLSLGDQSTRYVIESGTSLTQLANDFKKKGLLDHPSYLVWYARWKGKANQIKAGEYELTVEAEGFETYHSTRTVTPGILSDEERIIYLRRSN